MAHVGATPTFRTSGVGVDVTPSETYPLADSRFNSGTPHMEKKLNGKRGLMAKKDRSMSTDSSSPPLPIPSHTTPVADPGYYQGLVSMTDTGLLNVCVCEVTEKNRLALRELVKNDTKMCLFYQDWDGTFRQLLPWMLGCPDGNHDMKAVVNKYAHRCQKCGFELSDIHNPLFKTNG